MRSDVLADAACANWVGPVFILSPSLYSDRLYTQPSSLYRATTRQPSLRLARRAVAGAASEGWWSQTGSNRRPHACKARALPAELWPRTRRRNARPACRAEARVNQPAFARWAPARQPCSLRERRLVGLGRLELPTSRLSSARSNQLSYKPQTLILYSFYFRA
jgi:hypothetical protein